MVRTSSASGQTRSLLAELCAQPQAWRHGYELTKVTGVGSGTLYPALARLADQGLLESEWRSPQQPGRPARHAYRPTKAGLEFARAQPATIAAARNPKAREAVV